MVGTKVNRGGDQSPNRGGDLGLTNYVSYRRICFESNGAMKLHSLPTYLNNARAHVMCVIIWSPLLIMVLTMLRPPASRVIAVAQNLFNIFAQYGCEKGGSVSLITTRQLT